MYKISSADKQSISEVQSMLDGIEFPYEIVILINDSKDFLSLKEVLEDSYKGINIEKIGE